jgi:hypothetical protein
MAAPSKALPPGLIPLEETRWQRQIVMVRRDLRQLLPAARLLLNEIERQAQLSQPFAVAPPAP